MELNKALYKMYNLSELQTLCFDLGIPWHELGGVHTLSSKVLEIIQYCQKHNRLEKLSDYIWYGRGVKVILPETIKDGTVENVLAALDAAEAAIKAARKLVLENK